MSAPVLFHAERGWLSHKGRGCPVSPTTKVSPQYRCGCIPKHVHEAQQLRWSHKGEPFDIMAYLIVEAGE